MRNFRCLCRKIAAAEDGTRKSSHTKFYKSGVFPLLPYCLAGSHSASSFCENSLASVRKRRCSGVRFRANLVTHYVEPQAPAPIRGYYRRTTSQRLQFRSTPRMPSSEHIHEKEVIPAPYRFPLDSVPMSPQLIFLSGQQIRLSRPNSLLAQPFSH